MKYLNAPKKLLLKWAFPCHPSWFLPFSFSFPSYPTHATAGRLSSLCFEGFAVYFTGVGFWGSSRATVRGSHGGSTEVRGCRFFILIWDMGYPASDLRLCICGTPADFAHGY